MLKSLEIATALQNTHIVSECHLVVVLPVKFTYPVLNQQDNSGPRNNASNIKNHLGGSVMCHEAKIRLINSYNSKREVTVGLVSELM